MRAEIFVSLSEEEKTVSPPKEDTVRIMMVGKTWYFIPIPQHYRIMGELSVTIKKTNIVFDVCLHSETPYFHRAF